MKVTMIGTGYIGLVSGVCLAEIGHDVLCLDIAQGKIDQLRQGLPTIYEPGLDQLLFRNQKSGRLHFDTDFKLAAGSDFVFLGVGTPSTENGDADLSAIWEATKNIAPHLSATTVLVIKSTVPVGTWKKVEKILFQYCTHPIPVVNNPEFLKEGQAIDDFMRPDRIVIGHQNAEAAKKMEELYAPLLRRGNTFIQMTNASAELTKYASNAFLATKISFINEMSHLCEATGADIEDVRKGMISDRRIGPYFLYPGPGYGGSCFPKDVRAILAQGRQHEIELPMVAAANQVNLQQQQRVFKKISQYFSAALAGKRLTFWGVTFKPNTDDVRESPAIALAHKLISAGAEIAFYDPMGTEAFLNYFSEEQRHAGKIVAHQDKYAALKNAHGLIIITDWPEFKAPHFDIIAKELLRPFLYDTRNLYHQEQFQGCNFHYFCTGRPPHFLKDYSDENWRNTAYIPAQPGE